MSYLHFFTAKCYGTRYYHLNIFSSLYVFVSVPLFIFLFHQEFYLFLIWKPIILKRVSKIVVDKYNFFLFLVNHGYFLLLGNNEVLKLFSKTKCIINENKYCYYYSIIIASLLRACCEITCKLINIFP